MKHRIGVTIDSELFREIERLRGREKRSTFIEHLIRPELKEYTKQQKRVEHAIQESQKAFKWLSS